MRTVYAGGHLTGGHYPAVTVAALVQRRIGMRDAAAYWVVQLGPGLLAALMVRTGIVPAQITATATTTLLPQTCWRRL